MNYKKPFLYLFLMLFLAANCSVAISDVKGESDTTSDNQKTIWKIKHYFKSLSNVTIHFKQRSQGKPDLNGTLRLKKPTTLSIKYAPPHGDTFTLNSNLRLEYFDSEMQEKTEIPLPRIFDIILFDNFDNVKIISLEEIFDKIELHVGLEDNVALFVFQKNPIRLLSWTIEQGDESADVYVTKIVKHVK